MNSSSLLTDPEKRRFNHQIQLPEVGIEGQEKIKKASVAVVGAGGLGASVLQFLSALGVGTLGIIDYNMVEEANVQLQTLYGANDLGKLKTIIAKQNLSNVFKNVNYEIINLKLTSENIIRVLQPFNIVVDASNNNSTSSLINDACNKLNIPWVLGITEGYNGIVTVFSNNDNFTLQKYVNDVSFDKDNVGEGGIVLTYALAANIMASEVIKILVNPKTSLIGSILKFDASSYEFSISSLKKTFVNNL